MPGNKPSYLNVSMYTVSKQIVGRVATAGYVPLVFKDPKGEIILTASKGGIGRHAILVDPQGKQVGSVQKKGISLGRTAKYQFFDENNNQIGQVVIKSGLMGLSETISMQDPSGNAVASATGNFAGFNYEVSDANGNKTLVKIYRDTGKQQNQQQGGGLKGLIGQFAGAAISTMMGAYKIEVVDMSINDMSRLFILELVVVLDEMYQPNQGGFTMGPGGGGINI